MNSIDFFRSRRISRNLWSESKCVTSMGDLEPLQCGEQDDLS
jgi:hypothetical protein